MTTPVFNIEKSINAALYVANRVQVKDFHKIFKLIYFADREHLSNYGRVITGDSYVAMKDGPVPSSLYDIFKAVRGDSYFKNVIQEFKKHFIIEHWNYINPLHDADLNTLSQSDIEELDNSIDQYGELSWKEIREKSHDRAYYNTTRDRLISIEDIMYEKGESNEYVQFVTKQIQLKKTILDL